ncbi:DUF397 domain-containing protein [Streptomyces sp. NPDC001194]|uniref:DUF397 domain-containing protein n=1 Tax=Streptomyces sp. NPDC001194 TaxID=3364547 RepID=UPI00369CCB9E
MTLQRPRSINGSPYVPAAETTHSGGSGGDCLEVADGHPDLVPVRDYKVPDGPHLTFNGPAWTAFVTSLG